MSKARARAPRNATIRTRSRLCRPSLDGRLCRVSLIARTVDGMSDQTSNTTQPIEAGRIRAFAVTTAKPLSDHPLLKYYPSLQEMGLKDFDLTIWHGLYAPKGTPAPVVKTRSDALRAVLQDPEFILKQRAQGASVPSLRDRRITPEGHKAFVTSEIAQLKAIVDAAGLCAD